MILVIYFQGGELKYKPCLTPSEANEFARDNCPCMIVETPFIEWWDGGVVSAWEYFDIKKT